MSEASKQQRPLYTLIIPVLDSCSYDQVKDQCAEILTFSQSTGLHLELIFVANPKSNLSKQKLSPLPAGARVDFAKRQLTQSQKLISGLEKSLGSWCVFLDAERSVPLSELINCMGYFEADPQCKAILGERTHKSQNALVGRPDFWEELIEKSLNDAFRQNLIQEEKDPRCPFAAIHFSVKDDFGRAALSSSLFIFSELKMFAAQKQWPTIRHPIRWVYRKKSRISLLKEMFNSFRDLSLLQTNYGKKIKAMS